MVDSFTKISLFILPDAVNGCGGGNLWWLQNISGWSR